MSEFVPGLQAHEALPQPVGVSEGCDDVAGQSHGGAVSGNLGRIVARIGASCDRQPNSWLTPNRGVTIGETLVPYGMRWSSASTSDPRWP